MLAHALATIVSREGEVLVRELVPERIPDSVRAALADCAPEPGEDEPAIRAHWPWSAESADSAQATGAFGSNIPVVVTNGFLGLPVSVTPIMQTVGGKILKNSWRR